MSEPTNHWPDYQALWQTFIDQQYVVTPAELQGIALGLICGGEVAKAGPKWQEILVEQLNITSLQTLPYYDELQQLFQISLERLQAAEFAFCLFLPEDEQALRLRTEALGTWCKGLVYGLGVSGFDAEKFENPLVQEAMQDLIQIIHLEVEDTATDEQAAQEQERAYFELVEYLRMVVVLLYTENLSAKQEQGKSVYGLH